MARQGLELLSNAAIPICSIAGIVAAFLVAAKVFRRSELDAIPTVGSSSWLGSWRAGFTFASNGINLIREGYEKYRYKPFKVADHHHWVVIVSSRKHLDELQRAPDDQLSFGEVIRSRMSSDYTMGKHIHLNHYHIPLIHKHITHNLDALSPVIRDEITTGFEDILNMKCNEWRCAPVLDTVRKIVFRTTNRIFVGSPLCRDPDWMDFNMQNASDIFTGLGFLQLFPPFLAPFMSFFITNISHTARRGMKYLAPLIEERRRRLDNYQSECDESPTDDLLSHMINVAEAEERTPKYLTTRIMALNFSAIHTVAQSFSHALINLAANPQYMQPLREEAEAVVAEEGWSKAALDKMHKIDSFLKENLRMNGIGGEVLSRKVLKDFKFSDGTFIPKGTMISAPSICLHLDDDVYENAKAFEPFRFAKMREVKGEGTKHQFVSTSLNYMPFGHGRNACPGRFLVAHQMKSMLAHVVLTYDLELEDENVPRSIHAGSTLLVNPEVNVIFRRRK